MSPPSAAALGGVALALVWAVTLLRFHRAGRAFPELHPGSPSVGSGAAAPSLSLVVAVKDEEAHVESCVRSLLAQDLPGLELVVVDDRSQDRTPAIVERLQEEAAGALSVLRIELLPAGWGGQSHALQRGVEASAGEWLAFTDADCRLESPRALAIAWREAEAHGVDLLSILPRMEAPSSWEKAYLPLCSFVLLTRLGITRVNDPEDEAAYANGAFLLLRRAAYERLGGHERVRGLVNDDVALARLAKRAGLRIRVVSNRGLLHTRMYGSLGAAWSGWARNFYGTLHGGGRLLTALSATAGLFLLPWTGFACCLGAAATGDPRWDLAALAWVLPLGTSHLGLARLYAACGVRPLWSLLYPAGALFVTALLGRAALQALRQAGTTWHGVHYGHPASEGGEGAV